MTVEYLMEIYGEFVQNFWQLFTLFVFVFVFVHGYVCINVYRVPFFSLFDTVHFRKMYADLTYGVRIKFNFIPSR